VHCTTPLRRLYHHHDMATPAHDATTSKHHRYLACRFTARLPRLPLPCRTATDENICRGSTPVDAPVTPDAAAAKW